MRLAFFFLFFFQYVLKKKKNLTEDPPRSWLRGYALAADCPLLNDFNLLCPSRK